jgi:hypothetical protein
MKLARLYTGRHEFIALQASFHGRSWGALSVTGNMGRKKRGGPYAAGVTFAPVPYAYRSQWPNDPEECGRQCAQAIEDVIRFTTADDVAAFIAEPVMGEGGIIVPPPNYFKEVKKGSRPPRHTAYRGRSPVRLRPHGKDVCHRTLRRRARHSGDGKGHRGRVPAERFYYTP